MPREGPTTKGVSSLDDTYIVFLAYLPALLTPIVMVAYETQLELQEQE